MDRPRWWSQLRFQVLAAFVIVFVTNYLYGTYAIRHILGNELPQFELQMLGMYADRLQSDVEQAYARTGRFEAQGFAPPPQLAWRIHALNGANIATTDAFATQPAMVRQAFDNTPTALTVVSAHADQPFGYQARPLHHGDVLIGVLEVAQQLPPINRMQASLEQQLGATTLVTLCSMLACSLYLSVRFGQMLRHIKGQTVAIVHGNFERRIPVRSNNEFGQIADYLNQMAEDLHSLAKSRNEFFGKVSHELRTPLTVAKGYVSMLHRGTLDAKQQRTVRVVDEQLDHLTNLVNDMLDVSRHQHNTTALTLAQLDATALLGEVVEQQRHALRGQNIALEAHYTVEHALVQADRKRLLQALSNLASNAARYAQGRVTLELNADDEQVYMCIHDDGVGIEPEDQARIFEPFFQGRHGPRGGTGLGLTVARELVQAHGGTLSVDGARNTGTTFCVHLPRVNPLLSSKPSRWTRLFGARRERARARSGLGSARTTIESKR